MKGALRGVFVVCLGAIALFVPGVSTAENGYWEPAGIRPTGTATSVVLDRLESARGGFSSGRREHYVAVANGLTFDADATIRGEDFVVRSTLDGATYASGRSAGYHWRQTSAGVVHLVESDVQGDDLDRWPTSRLALSRDCVLVGESSATGGKAWVLLDRREHDIPHWFYVDEVTNAIVREVTREGTRVETTTLDDWRAADGATLPYHWRVDGPGGTLDVSVQTSGAAAVAAPEVAVPASVASTFAPPPRPEILRSDFNHARISLTAMVDGSSRSLLLDSGTPQIVIGSALTRKLGAHVALEHALLKDVTIGIETASNVPVVALNDTWDGGILGYDFFLGRIVHLDYANARVEELPRAGFSAPDDARELVVNYGEGMPIVAARVGSVAGERFVLDTGSPRIIVLAHLLRRKHRPASDLDFDVIGASRNETFLEGSIRTEPVRIRSLVIGSATFHIAYAELQDRTRSIDSEFPIDGIIGTDLLSHCEWWFDATGKRAWYRWQG